MHLFGTVVNKNAQLRLIVWWNGVRQSGLELSVTILSHSWNPIFNWSTNAPFMSEWGETNGFK